MNSQNIIFVIIGCILVGIGAILLFIFKALPLINSPAVAGLIGVLVGGFAGLLGSIVTSIVGI
jgi:ABC-type sulfate transport system permease subunit